MKTSVLVFIGLHLTDGEWHPVVVRRTIRDFRKEIADVLKQMDEEGW